jgi:hypothetical protein
VDELEKFGLPFVNFFEEPPNGFTSKKFWIVSHNSF